MQRKHIRILFMEKIIFVSLSLFLGLYIPADCNEVHEEFRGIGIRIEDDVLCTNDGIEVLTKDCCKNFEIRRRVS